MDLVSLLGLVIRRWAVAAPVLLLAIGVAVMVHRAVDPVFEAQGSVLISSASVDATPAPADIIDAAELAEIVQLSDSVAELSAGPSPVEVSIDASAPNILQVVASGEGEAAVSEGADTIAESVVSRTQGLQESAGIPEDERIQAVPLSEASRAIAQTTGETTTFIATQGVLLEDPSEGVENPYTASQGTARLVQVALEGDAGRARVFEMTDGAIDFAITREDFDQAPILGVWTYGPSVEQTLDGFSQVAAAMDEYLDARQSQAGVPARARVSVEVLAQPQTVRDVSPPISRAAAVVLALGVLLALGAAVLSENLASRRAGKVEDSWDGPWDQDLDRRRSPNGRFREQEPEQRATARPGQSRSL